MRIAMLTGVLPLVAGLTGCGLASDSALEAKDHGELAVFEGPVPNAGCGPGSNPESGLQGTPPSSPGEAPYTCNVELIGHQGGEASWQMAVYEDCAYYGTYGLGTQVVDVSDPADPQLTATLITNAMYYPHESLSANEARALLAGVQGTGGLAVSIATFFSGVDLQSLNQRDAPWFDVYDVSDDCKQPVMRASVPITNNGHEGNWAPDGMTYYGTGIFNLDAIDVSDPATPQLLYTEKMGVHGLSISDDGNRAYLANQVVAPGVGLTIKDVSQIQARAAEPRVSTISYIGWEDGDVSQMTIPVTIKGKPYIIIVDEGSAGAARILDISDEKNPFVISKLKLEVHMFGMGNGHYCGVPQREEPGILGCSYTSSGVRFFDIRDPYHPKEIAYYEPYAALGASARVHFVKERGEAWFTIQAGDQPTAGQTGGFYVVRLTNGVWPFQD